MTIANLVENYVAGPISMASGNHIFLRRIIPYAIKTKHISLGNPQARATIKRIHQILGNIVITHNLQ